MLDSKQLKRFERNIRLAGVGESGQEKLLKSAVLVIGAGGLGSAAILYLAAAGIGALLGLSDWRTEAACLAMHAEYLMKKFWRADISISFPRLRKSGSGFSPYCDVADKANI